MQIRFQMLSFSSFKRMSKNHSGSRHSGSSYYYVPRVPPGLTADDIAHAVAVAYGTEVNKVRLVPANPIFRYGGVQHAAIITMPASDLEATHVRVVYDSKVVYDLEAQLHFTIQKMNGPNQDLEKEKERLWRWALRGIVIQ